MSERLSFKRDHEPHTQELSAELQATYERKQLNKIYPLGCGDEREPTPESLDQLQQDHPEPK